MRLRCMTSVYLFSQQRVLLLYRIGSRVVAPSWCGIGGHFEPDELNNPRACVLRELREETGITSASLSDLQMRYLTVRNNGHEIRQNYYFFANLTVPFIPGPCAEGTLCWFDTRDTDMLPMPSTARAVFSHYLREGRGTDLFYTGTVTASEADADGARVVFIPCSAAQY